MDKVFAIIVALLILIIITVVFAQLISRRDKFIEIEKGKELVNSFTCGATFVNGLVTTRLTYPFVKVRLYNEFMVISYFKQLVFKYSEINMKKSFHGTQIIHSKSNYPKKVYLSIDRERLMNYIKHQENI